MKMKKKMKIVYLASGHAVLNVKHSVVVYQDKKIKRDLTGCMLDVNLIDYDLVVARPPSNYWSRANYRRETSDYSLQTKHLLPDIINKLSFLDIPFIVENVINKKLMKDLILNLPPHVHYFEHGKHCYFSNVYSFYLILKNIPQMDHDYVKNKSQKQRQERYNVNAVFETFINYMVMQRCYK